MHSRLMDQSGGKDLDTTSARHYEDVRLITLLDGRRLAYTEYGERTGYPLFHCHSQGSSRLEAASFHKDAKQAGFRIIAIDRPGIGLSDFDPNTCPASFATDLSTLAAELRCKRFGVLANGAGTAYALTVAALYPQRVSVILGLSGRFPVFTENGSATQTLLRILASASIQASILLRHWRGVFKHGHYLERLVDSLCYADRRILDNPKMLAILENDAREALRQGARGIAKDAALQFKPLPLNFKTLQTPCHFWLGSAEGVNSRVRTERFIGMLPNAQLHEVLNRGHYFYLRTLEDVFAKANVLLDRVKKPTLHKQAPTPRQLPTVIATRAALVNR